MRGQNLSGTIMWANDVGYNLSGRIKSENCVEFKKCVGVKYKWGNYV